MVLVSKLKQRHKQKGFTLIELMVVVVILGILLIMVANPFKGTADPANAKAMRSFAKATASAIGIMHAQLGTGTNALSNPITKPGLTMMDVIVVGEDAVNSAYLSKYKSLNARPLDTDVTVITRPSGSSPGSYAVVNFPVSFQASCATVGKICLQFDVVPSDTLQQLAQDFGIEFDSSQAITTGNLRYTAADGNGKHVVKMITTP